MENQTAPLNVTPFVSLLVSEKPSPDLGIHAGVYAPLIGSWKVTTIDHDVNGDKHTSTGEWHFTWALDGRAIQDVLVNPGSSQRYEGMSRVLNRYGTTIRFFNEKTGKWKLFWFNPVNSRQNELEATLLNGNIVQNGKDEAGNLLRWTFSDITPASFYWLGEASPDGGATWTTQTEFFAIRI
ncbi:hypothetical protein ACPPVU_02410 [Mucilaginibacter sp. McL0603]|uniref:hypothetical protein n=1 Tax=Mucilaginibacter sp. McL0603 TaxID=3415670 RepID=UPI003CEF81CE